MPQTPQLPDPPTEENLRLHLLHTIALEELALATLIQAEKVSAVAAAGLHGPSTPEELARVSCAVAEILQQIVAKEERLLKKLAMVGLKGELAEQSQPDKSAASEVELVFTANDMYTTGGSSPSAGFPRDIYPPADPTSQVSPAKGARIPGWGLALDPPSDPVSVAFKVPNSYLAGTAIAVEAHVLLARTQTPPAAGNLRLRLRADFRSESEQWGQATDSPDYKHTVLSEAIFVKEPAGATERLSARHYVLLFQLPGTHAHPRDWAIVSVDRVPADQDDYARPVSLGILSLRCLG